MVTRLLRGEEVTGGTQEIRTWRGSWAAREEIAGGRGAVGGEQGGRLGRSDGGRVLKMEVEVVRRQKRWSSSWRISRRNGLEKASSGRCRPVQVF